MLHNAAGCATGCCFITLPKVWTLDAVWAMPRRTLTRRCLSYFFLAAPLFARMVPLLFSASYILLKKIVDFFIIPAMKKSYIDHGFARSQKIIQNSTSCCTPWSVAAGGGNLCWLVGAPLLLGSALDQDFSSLKLHSCPKTSWVASTSSSACFCPPWLVTSTMHPKNFCCLQQGGDTHPVMQIHA